MQNKLCESGSMFCLHIIEVRDSRTGYFIPVRHGIGVWPDGRVVGASPSSSPSASSGNSGRHSGQGTIFAVLHIALGCGERYLRMETGVLHRISIQIL